MFVRSVSRRCHSKRRACLSCHHIRSIAREPKSATNSRSLRLANTKRLALVEGLSGFQVQLLQNEVRIVRPVVGVFVVVVKRGMRSAPAVTEIATSHFPPRQTSKPFDVNDP